MSMSFYPATATPMVEGNETYTLIAPIHGFESMDDINLSNSNARAVLAALGIDADEGGTIDLAAFAGLASSWLQHNIGKRSAEIESIISRGALGATIVDCGLREGYLNEKIHALASMARIGLANGATLMAWG